MAIGIYSYLSGVDHQRSDCPDLRQALGRPAQVAVRYRWCEDIGTSGSGLPSVVDVSWHHRIAGPRCAMSS